MPSNTIRGIIVNGLANFWSNNPIVKAISGLVLALDTFYLYDTFNHLYFKKRRKDGAPLDHTGPWGDCERRLHVCRDQRNAYITGFSIFVFLVMWRLLTIQKQLYDARKIVKDAKKK